MNVNDGCGVKKGTVLYDVKTEAVRTVQVVSYGKQYTQMDLKLFNEKRRLYELVKLNLILRELQLHGMKVVKWNKPTKKGTYAKYRRVKDEDEVAKTFQEIQNWMADLNKQFGYSFQLETFEDNKKG